MSEFKDNVKVAVRIRPLNEKEANENSEKCLTSIESKTILLDSKPEPRSFTYDNVAEQNVTQEEIFEIVGKPITTSCIKGYNGTIFAYGQTGAGKTFTIQGAGFEEYASKSAEKYQMRGILPRCFEFLFSSISEEIAKKKVQYLVKCSYLEIYQEQINDLLDQNPRNLQLREDMKKGVYVEGLIEESVANVMETYELLNIGAQNRHVSSTGMNKESSRSHSVFTLIIESKTNTDGLVNFRTSRFHLIDLAGSERQKATDCAGDRLKEAGMINKSLSALGNVINSLVDISEGKSRHVHYRDSKLTFLLKDSLGGNSKTFIIANVSPATSAFAETLSTLKFAQRAKMIKNTAVVNEDVTGTVNLLKYEIKKLKDELSTQKTLNSDTLGVCPICTSVLSRNYELYNLLDSNKELEILVEKNTRLRLASEKHLEQSCVDKDKQIKALKAALSKIESKANHDKMVLKFRDATIAKFQGVSDCDEVENLKKENLSLREQVENNPVAAQFFVENEKLKADCEQLKKECKYDPESLNGRIRDGYEYTERLCDTLKSSAEEKLKIMLVIESQNKEIEKNHIENERLEVELERKTQEFELEKESLLNRIRELLKANKMKNQDLDGEEDLIRSAEKIEELLKNSEALESMQSISNNNHHFEQKIQELNSTIEKLTLTCTEDSIKIKELEEKLKISEQELIFYTEKAESKESQVKQVLQESENLTDSCEYLKSNIEILNKTINQKSQLISDHENTIKRLENQQLDLINSIDASKESMIACESLTKKIEDLEKTKEKLVKANQDLSNEKSRIEALYETVCLQEMAEKKHASELYKKLGNVMAELEEIKESEKNLIEKLDVYEDEKVKNDEIQLMYLKSQENLECFMKLNTGLENTVKNMESHINNLTDDKSKLEKTVKNMESRIKNLDNDKSQLENTVKNMESRIKNLDDEKLKFKKTEEFLSDSSSQYLNQLKASEALNQNLSQEIKALVYDKAKLTEENEALSVSLSKSNDHIRELESKVSELDSRIQSLDSKLQNLSKKLISKKGQIASLKQENERLTLSSNEASTTLQSLWNELQEAKTQLASTSDQNSQLLQRLKIELAQAQSENEVLKLETEDIETKYSLILKQNEKIIHDMSIEKKDLQGLVLENSGLIQSLHQKILDEESKMKAVLDLKNELTVSLNEKNKVINFLQSKLNEETELKDDAMYSKTLVESNAKQNEEYIRDLHNNLENERSFNQEHALKRIELEKIAHEAHLLIETLESRLKAEQIKNEDLLSNYKEIENELSTTKDSLDYITYSLKAFNSNPADPKTPSQSTIISNPSPALKIILSELEHTKLTNIKLSEDHVHLQAQLKNCQKALNSLADQKESNEKTLKEILCDMPSDESGMINITESIKNIKKENEENKNKIASLTETLIQEKKRTEILNKESEILRSKINKLKQDHSKEVKNFKEEVSNLDSKVLQTVETSNKVKLFETSIQDLNEKLEKCKDINQNILQEKNILESKVCELNEINEKLANELSESKTEIDSLREENKNKMDILKNTNKNIICTRNEINMWKKCIDDKNQFIQELKNEMRKKDEEILKYQNDLKNKYKAKKESPEKEENPEIKYLNQIIQIKEKELKDLKEKGQEYYSQADEALESQRKEIEIFTKRCTSLQGEVKRLKEELRISMKDRESLLEEVKKLKNEEYKNFRDNEDMKKMLNQTREEKNKLIIELSKENDSSYLQKIKVQEKLHQENLFLRAQVEKLTQDVQASAIQKENLISKLRSIHESSLKKEIDRQSEEINSLTEGLSKITDCVFNLPQVSIHPEETSIIESTIRAIKSLSDQLSQKDQVPKTPKSADFNPGPTTAFKSQLAQYYALVNRTSKSPTNQRNRSAFK